jgi:hypothetical protein
MRNLADRSDSIWVGEQVKTLKLIDVIFGLQFGQTLLLKNRDEKSKRCGWKQRYRQRAGAQRITMSLYGD